MITKAIADSEVISHGYMVSDYFQGCGICGTEFDDVATGCGSTRHEAYDDALEQLAQGGWDVESLGEAGEHGPDHSLPPGVDDDCYFYVSVRVK